MAIIINTNLPAMLARNAMDFSTSRMNRSMIRLSTGSKLNSAKDNPSGVYMAMRLNTQIRGIQVAYQNVSEASNMVATAESALNFVNDHLERIKELAAECANSSVSAQQKEAIKREVQSRVDEINRISSECKFNDIHMLNGSFTSAQIQVGAGSDTATNSLTVNNVFGDISTGQSGLRLFGGTYANVDEAFDTQDTASAFMDIVEDAIETVTNRITNAGIYDSRFESIANLLIAQNENLTSTYSTIADADIATETSEYVKYQILQQTASSLLSQANQASGVIALKLVSALG